MVLSRDRSWMHPGTFLCNPSAAAGLACAHYHHAHICTRFVCSQTDHPSDDFQHVTLVQGWSNPASRPFPPLSVMK